MANEQTNILTMSMGAFKWAPNMMVKMLFYH